MAVGEVPLQVGETGDGTLRSAPPAKAFERRVLALRFHAFNRGQDS